VVAEAARHGGLALCCPIALRRRAPPPDARPDGRRRLHLVHTDPRSMCEERDPKGLYAKAREGRIAHMTGVDDPYEEPTDADLVIDTSQMTVEQAVDTVLDHLVVEGWLDRP
jgi:sulfate adenylyltransferase